MSEKGVGAGGAAGGAVQVPIVRRTGTSAEPTEDVLTVEEPLEVRLVEEGGGAPGSDPGGIRFVVTMRTPGDDEDLAAGLVFGEGVVASPDEIVSIGRLPHAWLDPDLARNVVLVTLTRDGARAARVPRRATVMGSACGVCGRTSVEDVLRLAACARSARGPRDAECDGMSQGPAVSATPVLPAGLLASLPAALRERQSLFDRTGGIHAAGLFEADGTLVVVREDVGRHNATDKAIGACLRARRPVPPVLVVSGRAGFEIVQKAALAGVKIVAAVSAPTSTSVALAEEAGITLAGFVRGDRFNVYAHPGRIS